MGGYTNNQSGDDNDSMDIGPGHEVHKPSDGKFTILGVNVII